MLAPPTLFVLLLLTAVPAVASGQVTQERDTLTPVPSARVAPEPRQQRSLGSRVLRGAGIGALAGAGAGIVVGAAIHDGYSCSDGGFCFGPGAGAIVGTVGGAVVGSLVALVSSGSGDRPDRSGVSVLTAQGPAGSFRIGVAMSR